MPEETYKIHILWTEKRMYRLRLVRVKSTDCYKLKLRDWQHDQTCFSTPEHISGPKTRFMCITVTARNQILEILGAKC